MRLTCNSVHWTLKFLYILTTHCHMPIPHSVHYTVIWLYLATPLTPGQVSSGYHHRHHHSCHRESSSRHQKLLGRQRRASVTRSVATLQPPKTTHNIPLLTLYDWGPQFCHSGAEVGTRGTHSCYISGITAMPCDVSLSVFPDHEQT